MADHEEKQQPDSTHSRKVQQLIDMGFDAARATSALQAADSSVEAAITILTS